MRFDTNQVFENGVVVDQTIVPWTLEQYDIAIASNLADKEDLITERAALLGVNAMTARIDQVADAKRMEFLGDVTRAFEYQAAERDAKAYEIAGFEGKVPSTVQAWSDATGMTTKQAAESILAEAFEYNRALNGIRALRLQGKQAVKNAPTAEQARAAYLQTIANINNIGK